MNIYLLDDILKNIEENEIYDQDKIKYVIGEGKWINEIFLVL